MSSGLDTLIASWQERRTLLLRQLQQLEDIKIPQHAEVRAIGGERDLIQQDIERINSWIADLNGLIEQYKT